MYESGPLRAVTGPTIRPGGLTLTDRALTFCRFAGGAELLDVGCGAGASVDHLVNRYGFVARGVDSSPALIAEGLGRNRSLPLAEATAEALPFADESQDGILCECVLSLLEEPRTALLEFQRVLRRGGYLILSDMYSREVTMGARSEDYLRVASAPGIFPPLQGEGRGGDGVDCVISLSRNNETHPPPNLPLERGGTKGSKSTQIPRGATSRGQVEEWLSAHGFATLLWEDHTPMLRELAARLILAGGSLEAVGCATKGTGQRPGYYLLVARKR